MLNALRSMLISSYFFLNWGISDEMGDASLPNRKKLYFFYLGFLSRTFTIHRTAGEGRGYYYSAVESSFKF